MYHYVNTYSEKYPAPWYDDFSYDIKTVVVEEGVTSIGNYAFYQCGELATVELADSVLPSAATPSQAATPWSPSSSPPLSPRSPSAASPPAAPCLRSSGTRT